MNSQASGGSRLLAPGFCSKLKPPSSNAKKYDNLDPEKPNSQLDIPSQVLKTTTNPKVAIATAKQGDKHGFNQIQGRFSLQPPKQAKPKSSSDDFGPELNFHNKSVQGPSSASAGGLSQIAGRGIINNKLIENEIIPKIGKGTDVETVTQKSAPSQTPKVASSKAESFVEARPAATVSKIGVGIGKGSAAKKHYMEQRMPQHSQDEVKPPQKTKTNLMPPQDQDQSPTQPTNLIEQDSKLPRRATSTMPSTKFGFRSGGITSSIVTQSASNPLESQPREEESIPLPQQMSPAKQGTVEGGRSDNKLTQYRSRMSVTRLGMQKPRNNLPEKSRSKSAHRLALANTIENAKLEQTIKTLEHNISQLPTTFNRTSRLKEFTLFVPMPKIVEQPQYHQISVQQVHHTPSGLHTPHQNAQGTLRNRLTALRDQKKIAKISQFENNAPNKYQAHQCLPFDMVTALHSQSVHQIPADTFPEEKSVPLTAYLPSTSRKVDRLSFIQQAPQPIVDPFAPAGDADHLEVPPFDLCEEEEEDESLLINQQEDGMLIDFELEDDTIARVEERRVDVQQMSELEEVKASAPHVIIKDRPLKNISKHGESAKKEEDGVANQHGASSLSNLDGGLMPLILFKTMQSFNPHGGSLISVQSHQQPPKVGLSACQKLGPGLAAKKAFEHKRRRFTKDLNPDSQNPTASQDDPRKECEHCGRRFNADIFEKHDGICERVFFKHRKPFNSLKQRVFEEKYLKVLEVAQTKFSYYNENQKLNTKWKIRRAQLQAAIKAARDGKPDSFNRDCPEQEDRIQCPYCVKKFAPATAERHIPLCEKKMKDLKFKALARDKPLSKTIALGFSNPRKGSKQ